jgi:hypothetical protein
MDNNTCVLFVFLGPVVLAVLSMVVIGCIEKLARWELIYHPSVQERAIYMVGIPIVLFAALFHGLEIGRIYPDADKAMAAGVAGLFVASLVSIITVFSFHGRWLGPDVPKAVDQTWFVLMIVLFVGWLLRMLVSENCTSWF